MMLKTASLISIFVNQPENEYSRNLNIHISFTFALSSFKMKPLILILTVLFVVSFHLTGQVSGVNIGGNNFTGSFQISPDNYADPVLGTPYLNPDWMYGNLVLADQTELEGLFRYNVYGQELEMVYNEDTLGISAPFSVGELSLSNKRFIHSLLIEKEYREKYLSAAFFEVVYDGNCQLLIKHRADVENNSYSTTYMGGGGDGRDYYVHKSSYYYKIAPGTAAKKVKRRKKDLLRIFGSHETEIKSYMKSERINPRVDEDLLALFRYYNEIEK